MGPGAGGQEEGDVRERGTTMSSPYGDRDESMYAGEGGTGKQENPAHRRAARGKAAGVIIGVVLLIFVVLLTIFMLASSNDGEEDASSQSLGSVVVLLAGA